MSYDEVTACADYVRAKHGGPIPETAMVLGSGLNSLADSVQDATVLSYGDLPHFPKPTVEGHSGRMLIGTLDGNPVICMQGRAHAYEGHAPDKLVHGVRLLWALGVKTLILTNAAGSLKEQAGPGSLMAITDHINLSGISPLAGPNDDRFGPRFPDVTNAWDPELTDILRRAANALHIDLHDGVYLMTKGPNFETPAEIHAFRTLGADAVGMSTVPECLAARHCGLRVVGISSITNFAAGMTGNALSHEETIEYGALASVNLEKLLRRFLTRIS
ncbi:purine-nucleoside phosphorylase [Eilatimonas milleporae]|uniref:Purine nucleoside phosphorylase n=1 Tax=Eilatimonas milleporae TaxID=911205 RepID=A0A3M0D068_9PROT|nr:purine-nucleoside phosphorylase [Eilatimonas milleporae]RMB13056.1 xanthosine phosphorylase [Eilatimonas milleporae]